MNESKKRNGNALTIDNMTLVKEMDDGWAEYQTTIGRKIYHKSSTNELSWKPPRKSTINTNNTPNPKINLFPFQPQVLEDSIGRILVEDFLRVKTDKPGVDKKNKWVKVLAVLTDSYFLFTADKIQSCLPLKNAEVTALKVKPKKPNKYLLVTNAGSVKFYNKNALQGEIWFHAIMTVIEENSCGDKLSNASIKRSSSFQYHQPKPEETSKKTEVEPKVTAKIEKPTGLSLGSPVHQFLTTPVKNAVDKKIISTNAGRYRDLTYKFPTPPGWTARFDSKNQRYVYENLQLNEAWGASQRNSGTIIFYDLYSDRTSFLLPSKSGQIDFKPAPTFHGNGFCNS